ncbi:MAG: putative bifunctional diguanylate cyclase/phosphodiesterase [Acidiferrobacteraceae bacterium]
MGEKLRVLVVEDSEDDAELLMRELRRGGHRPHWRRVETAQDMRSALTAEPWDVALSDNTMPRFSAASALQVLRESGIDIPFIIVSGTISEDLAVNAMKSGANDYIQKNHLGRLIPAIEREIREAKLRADRRAAQSALAAAEQRFRILVEHSPVGVYIMEDGRLTYANPRMAEIFGYTADGLLGLRSVLDLVSPGDRAFVRQAVREWGASERSGLNFRFLGRKATGDEVAVEVSGNAARIEGRNVLIGTVLDVTERERARQRIRYLADHDDLTGLPNRRLLLENLKRRLDEATERTRVGIVSLNVNRLKALNDGLGRQAGDLVLREAAGRLLAAKEPFDCAGRIGGNDFGVVLWAVERAEDAALQAERLLKPFCAPFVIDGQDRYLTASAGIALYPDDGSDAELLLDAADAAAHRVHDADPGGGYRFFTREMTDRTRRRIAIENGVRRALKEEGFVLHYQPKISLADRKMVGVEALLRWRRPDGHLAAPGEFIGIAEETGLIWSLGEWVLRTACSQAHAWSRMGLDVPIAVNVSGRQFDQEGMSDLVTDILATSRLRPDLLELELTESVLMHNLEQTIPMLDRLNNAGVRLSIDDFGTGYSSLAYLKRFPIDTLKIDRSFVSEVPWNHDDSAIARAMVQMGHALGVQVVAEGVEREAQLEFLHREGCDQAQGFLLGMPTSAERLPEVAAGRWQRTTDIN